MQAGNENYTDTSDLPDTVPVFPLTGALLLPGGQMPLNIFENRYLLMVDHSLADDRIIAMIQPAGFDDSQDNAKLCEVGCLGRITAMQESGDGRYMINLSGICRFRVREVLDDGGPYRRIAYSAFRDDLANAENGDTVNREALLDSLRRFLDANGMQTDWDSIEKTDNATLVTALCMMCPYGPAEKQALLEAPDVKTRADTLVALTEFNLAASSADIDSTLQ